MLTFKGNKKISSRCGIFSMTPVKSCVDCKTCKSTCYALQAYRQYTRTRVAWDRNFKLSKTLDFTKLIIGELKHHPRKKIVRLHASGDFYSDEYIQKWYDIIKNTPDKMFYGYTKNPKALRLNELDNCNIIYSFINGYRNYGTLDYCQKLHDKFGAYICNLDESKGEKCMKDCTACLTHDKVAIVIHGCKASKDLYEQSVDL